MRLVEITDDILDALNLRFSLNFIVEEERGGGIYRGVLLIDKPVGMVAISSEKECMCMVDPLFRRQGIATRALTMLIKIVFDESGYSELNARTEIDRPGTRVLAKLGFKEVSRDDTEIHFQLTKDRWLNCNHQSIDAF